MPAPLRASLLLYLGLLATACSAGREATPTPTPTLTSFPAPTETALPSPTAATEAAAVLVGAGDIASCDSSGDEATAALLDAVFAGGASDIVVFTAGDDAYNSGSSAEFSDCYSPSWGRHKAKTRPAAGNHEYGTDGAAGYFGYFGERAGEPSKGYYSYDLDAWHVVVINSNCAEVGGCEAASPQERWLRADLAASAAVCTVAYWHHPLFSSGDHGNHPFMRDIWQALQDNGADVVLGGHDHDYERFAPQDASGAADPERGIRQFVVGTGGKRLYPFLGEAIANSEVRNADTFGVLKLTLHAASYDWEFIPVAGKTFTDSGRDSCH